MGMHANAYLFYGYTWEDETNDEMWDEYQELSWEVQKELVVEMDTHCHCDYSIPFIHVKGSRTTAYAGEPAEIDPTVLASLPEWDQQLADFCASFDIDLTEAKGPGWFLASYYG